MAKEIEKVLKGDNQDVERRHKHYVINSPSPDSNDNLKEVSEQQHSEKLTDIPAKTLIKKRQKNSNDIMLIGEVENQEIHNENNNVILNLSSTKKEVNDYIRLAIKITIILSNFQTCSILFVDNEY